MTGWSRLDIQPEGNAHEKASHCDDFGNLVADVRNDGCSHRLFFCQRRPSLDIFANDDIQSRCFVGVNVVFLWFTIDRFKYYLTLSETPTFFVHSASATIGYGIGAFSILYIASADGSCMAGIKFFWVGLPSLIFLLPAWVVALKLNAPGG